MRVSRRLTESVVCLVTVEGDMDMYLERLLRQHRQLDAEAITPRILEINPAHPLIRQLASRAAAGESDADLRDAAWLLLDQARIAEGTPIPDPAAFAQRLAAMMTRGFAAQSIK